MDNGEREVEGRDALLEDGKHVNATQLRVSESGKIRYLQQILGIGTWQEEGQVNELIQGQEDASSRQRGEG